MGFDPDISLKFTNYKSFSDEDQGFDRIAPLNIIIGRNNSGKSALLDLVDYATSPKDIKSLGHIGRTPAIYLTRNITQSVIKRIFPPNTSGGTINGDYYEYGKQWIDKPIKIELGPDGGRRFVKTDPEPPDEFRPGLGHSTENPFTALTFKRISAERDIQPEEATNPSLDKDGKGATNLIQYFLHESTADQKLVEVVMLEALNNIFRSDARFERIQTKRLTGGGRWEIHLEEKDKGNIALSNSGSGLKTIILVLAQTLLLPKLENKEVSQYIFGFEELENNLHPGLQRRLFDFIRKLAVEADATFFITTHSNVVIDLFSNDDKAQLLHVTHDTQSAQVKTLTEYLDKTSVLDDLDVRASDILQSNGVIWVEGPSDRVYVNHYINLISNGLLREGIHYQCVFYGGRLLARVTAEPDKDEHTNLLKVNHHCCLVMDSDIKKNGGSINSTKNRLKTEIDAIQGYVWITDAREIENSIPTDALRQLYRDESLTIVGAYQAFDEYLEIIQEGKGKKFLKNKVLYAEQVVPYITREMVEADIKLMSHVKKLCDSIAAWNKTSL